MKADILLLNFLFSLEYEKGRKALGKGKGNSSIDPGQVHQKETTEQGEPSVNIDNLH